MDKYVHFMFFLIYSRMNGGVYSTPSIPNYNSFDFFIPTLTTCLIQKKLYKFNQIKVIIEELLLIKNQKKKK